MLTVNKYFYIYHIKGNSNFITTKIPYLMPIPNGTVVTGIAASYYTSYYILSDKCFGIPSVNQSSCSGS
jgi:hypothetical protein